MNDTFINTTASTVVQKVDEISRTLEDLQFSNFADDWCFQKFPIDGRIFYEIVRDMDIVYQKDPVQFANIYVMI